MMIERVLLVINRSSGTGRTEEKAKALGNCLAQALGDRIETFTEVVDDHPAVSNVTRGFLSASEGPGLVIAGGGGGTLRAVVEAICEGRPPGKLPGADRVRVATLRMGSGNVFAKQLGVPREPQEGIRGVLANLESGSVVPGCVMRCEMGRENRATAVRYAVTMCGLGEFGRVPGDLVRWHRRYPRFRKRAARALGIERFNNVDYALALFSRFLSCAVRPSKAEEVEVHFRDEVHRLRLLAGVVMNFKIGSLPFEPDVRVDEPKLSAHLIPYAGRVAALGLVLFAHRCAGSALRFAVAEGDRLEIRLVDRGSAEFFLDEDPEVFHESMTIEPAGTLAFVPGSDYKPFRSGEGTQ
jgi:diacylglycerol kinase family enzyme